MYLDVPRSSAVRRSSGAGYPLVVSGTEAVASVFYKKNGTITLFLLH